MKKLLLLGLLLGACGDDDSSSLPEDAGVEDSAVGSDAGEMDAAAELDATVEDSGADEQDAPAGD